MLANSTTAYRNPRETPPHEGIMTIERPPMRTEEREPAWRRACLYHAWRQAGASGQEAHETVVAAVQTVLLLPWKDASIEAVNAIACATPSSSRVPGCPAR